MKIWLDDIRPKPNNFDVWFKDAGLEIRELILTEDALISLDNTRELIFISFDHDLGENKLTGYDLADWIEEGFYYKAFKNPIKWEIHSANPVGKKNIEKAMKNADKYWREK